MRRYYTTANFTIAQLTEEFGRPLTRKERLKVKYDFARDYAFKVFERYISRFGYLSTIKAGRFLGKIEDKYNWHSKAHLHMPYQRNLGQLWSDGPFCPIGDYGYVDEKGKFYRHEQVCEWCGSKTTIIKGFVIDKVGTELKDCWGGWVPRECSNQLCRESRLFISGNHDLLDEAKDNRVPLKRPISSYKKAETLEEKLVIASASMLDFEARLQAKQNNAKNKLRNRACQNS